MNELDLSVVIPTYNGSRFVAEAIESVFQQSTKPREILVIDDCSSDRTMEIVESMLVRSPIALEVHRLPVNSGGPSRPINVGVERAKSQWIAVLDHDDVYAPQALERAANALHASPNCNVAIHWMGRFNAPQSGPGQTDEIRNKLCSHSDRMAEHFVLPGQLLIQMLMEHGNLAAGFPGFVFRRSAWSEKGGIDESLRIAGDLEFLLWLGQHGDAAIIPQVGYLRRIHDSNAVHNRASMAREMGLVLTRCLQSLSEPEKRTLAALGAKQIEGLAYWLREGQQYTDATALYLLLAEFGRTKTSVRWMLAKLSLHQWTSRLTRRPAAPWMQH